LTSKYEITTATLQGDPPGKEQPLLPFIRLREVSYDYPTSRQGQEEFPALRDVSLDIYLGEFLAILGANGSGKSTLARHLNALLVPDKGTVEVAGNLSSDQLKRFTIRQLVGMVFQNPDNQIVATVVEEDVAFGLENLGLPRGEMQKRVAQVLQQFGLWEYRQLAPHLLSGGQKQRLAIAGVVAMAPQCIVFDEATAMLDPAGRREVLACMRQLCQQGHGIVLITQQVEEALMADRVVLLDEGRIATTGTPEEIFRQIDLLQRLQLEAPLLAELSWRLHGEGLLSEHRLRNPVEMAADICLSKRKI